MNAERFDTCLRIWPVSAAHVRREKADSTLASANAHRVPGETAAGSSAKRGTPAKRKKEAFSKVLDIVT
jgi:hypothetical protein